MIHLEVQSADLILSKVVLDRPTGIRLNHGLLDTALGAEVSGLDSIRLLHCHQPVPGVLEVNTFDLANSVQFLSKYLPTNHSQSTLREV